MTSESDTKTNEFLRRRRLRLQQVREQSKDIAKKLRQRAKVEQSRLIKDLDVKKARDYLEHQDNLVKRLELLYAQGVKNVGSSHQKASEVVQNVSPEKVDISKLRGREATAELRKTRQEKLDKQKKLLDRKLLAREAANELSREKSSNVAKKLHVKSTTGVNPDKVSTNVVEDNAKNNVVNLSSKVDKIDMATQWDFEEVPNEWDPSIPTLSLPKDDRDSVKDSNILPESKSDKSKRVDLFALSSEMPASLRGGFTNVVEEKTFVKPSLTMVSEYLQSRALRLRESDVSGSSKKQTDDLHCLKQTILHTRSSRFEVKGNDKSTKSNGSESFLSKKNSVTMYNHSTRNTRDIPCYDTGVVVRDIQDQEDAYSQALKETSNNNMNEKDHSKKIQEMRSKVAMTKQTVEKEYNDTMSFLKSLPKEKCSKHVKTSYLDSRRQQLLKDRRQQKLQEEFTKIEKESIKNCRGKHSNLKHTTLDNTAKKTKSPPEHISNELDAKDLQYSWMPVPESDGNLVIHTIPTTVKEGKTGNTVKFSKVDSYHEYRSRHKHTPPTKDTNTDGHTKKKIVETVLIQNDESESLDYADSSSDTSSVENLNLEKKNNKEIDQSISEAEKIIIYKILNSKMAKKQKERKKLKLIDDVAKVLTSMDREKLRNIIMSNDDNNNRDNKTSGKLGEEVNSSAHLENINEGVYKVVNEKGDNVTSLHYTEKPQEGNRSILNEEELRYGKPRISNKKIVQEHSKEKGSRERIESDGLSEMRTSNCVDCKCGCANNFKHHDVINNVREPSAATSASSFKTAATIDKAPSALPDGSFVKLLGNDTQEAGKFYIGAGGFLKDEAYEVIIQLRKKDSLNRSIGKTPEVVSSAHEIKKPDALSAQPTLTFDKDEMKSDENHLQSQDTEHKILSSPNSLHTSTDIPGASDQNVNLQPSIPEFSEQNMENSKKDLVDKGGCTTSQLSFAVPSDYPKTDPVPRPATSTYTQTSINSPNSVPVFVHMSSSTSTAYMSPPEIVLPKYLRREYIETKNHKDVVTSQDEIFEIREHHKYDKHYDECSCKHCMRQDILNSRTSKSKHGIKNINTPPNTARNIEGNSDVNSELLHRFTRNPHKNCHKCASRATSMDNNRHNQRKKRKVPLSKLSSRNIVMQVSSNATKPSKNNSSARVNKCKLNPVVKSYVNKLLELNSNSFKAIEIANQECSSVSTPGSSVVNVPRNINETKADIINKISLEQIKNTLKKQILDECVKQNENSFCPNKKCKSYLSRIPRVKRSLHKVKSLNISKKILKSKKSNNMQYPSSPDNKSNFSISSLSSKIDDFFKKPASPFVTKKNKSRSRSSPTPRFVSNVEYSYENTCSDVSEKRNVHSKKSIINADTGSKVNKFYKKKKEKPVIVKRNDYTLPMHKAVTASTDSEIANKRTEHPINTSTQTTSQDLDSEINLIKSAEDKIQNMEKIADLTEKCTKRLSNLAKVLEKVRRNKSLAYSHISTSDTASDSDVKSDKNTNVEITPSNINEPCFELHKDSNGKLPTTSNKNKNNSFDYIPFLKDIPKPEEFKYSAIPSVISTESEKNKTPSNIHELFTKNRTKPPPALSRINLKHRQDIVPHELSTVIEVDSPMSIKLKNQSSKGDVADNLHLVNNNEDVKSKLQVNPDLLQNKPNVPKRENKISTNDSPDDSKIQMMDIKQFNDVMLKPFISLQEYAKQYDVGVLDEGSNIGDNVRDEFLNGELSSLHSDGSLPDVIAELLKRNIIAEPFKFDTVSNISSTTVSSESTLSVLALSKVLKEKRKASVLFHNKENISETSDTQSISSNPDLENAFKKLGMGWASSTLKKTKERLALSSSSNTSSSSLSQFKLKPLNNQDIPSLVTDSVTSMNKTPKRQKHARNSADASKNAEQQTSFMNSMTVKEFLINELSKKITFTNKSNRNDTDEEFVSLLETKMPEEMKHSSQNIREDHSAESMPSGNNRARTSTPVQIFKSMTYHSSSSSNMSNGLFSNADELSSVKGTSNSMRNHSTSDKDDLTIPNCSLKVRKIASDCSNE